MTLVRAPSLRPASCPSPAAGAHLAAGCFPMLCMGSFLVAMLSLHAAHSFKFHRRDRLRCSALGSLLGPLCCDRDPAWRPAPRHSDHLLPPRFSIAAPLLFRMGPGRLPTHPLQITGQSSSLVPPLAPGHASASQPGFADPPAAATLLRLLPAESGFALRLCAPAWSPLHALALHVWDTAHRADCLPVRPLHAQLPTPSSTGRLVGSV